MDDISAGLVEDNSSPEYDSAQFELGQMADVIANAVAVGNLSTKMEGMSTVNTSVRDEFVEALGTLGGDVPFLLEATAVTAKASVILQTCEDPSGIQEAYDDFELLTKSPRYDANTFKTAKLKFVAKHFCKTMATIVNAKDQSTVPGIMASYINPVSAMLTTFSNDNQEMMKDSFEFLDPTKANVASLKRLVSKVSY